MNDTLPQELENWLALISPTKRAYVAECWNELQAGRRLPANTKSWAATARSRVLDAYRRSHGEDALALLGDVTPEAPVTRRHAGGPRKPRSDRGRSRFGLTDAMLAKRQEIIDSLDFKDGRIGGAEYHQALAKACIPSRANGLTIDSPEVVQAWGLEPKAETVPSWEEAKEISGLVVAWPDLDQAEGEGEPIVKVQSNEADNIDPLEEARNLSAAGLAAFDV